MTAPLNESELQQRWHGTLGADRDWGTVDPSATQKPAEPTTTLSGLATVAGAASTLSGQNTLGGTLSGKGTLGGTLSGKGTLGGDGAGATAGATGGAGNYELGEELGRGGMGVVYRARQRALAREIALKFIRPEQSGPATKERFISEALVNGLLDHPNIVPVHDLGTTGEGEIFLAMKLVGGRSWKALLHPETPEERAAAAACDLDRHLAILQGVGNAIAFAHSRGIVHRDLKPENVMVGEFGEILVMDWGIAVDVRQTPDGEQRAPHRSTVTAPSGTPSYMAPELAEGRGQDIGPATDIYLLGAILHEILTGQPPHRGRTLMQVLLAASRSAPPTWPASAPAGLAAIATQAMDRDPAKRFASVADFQAAIARFFKHRESERIGDSARRRLDEAAAMATADSAGRNRRYAAFAEAVAGFRQALTLWDGNAGAATGERQARLAYARAALTNGDLGLADAQLEPVAANVDEGLRGEIAQARAAAAKRESAAKRNRWLLGGSVGAIIVGLGIGVTVVNAERAATAEQRDKAIAATDKAVAAEGEAKRQEAKAKEQEGEARRQEGLAREESERARREQQAAEKARREIAGRFAQNAAAEARHARGADDHGASLLWLAEAVARDPEGAGSLNARLALAGRLLGLPRPLMVNQPTIATLGPGDDDGSYITTSIQELAGTGRRDRVLARVMMVLQQSDGTPAMETATDSVALWNPSKPEDTLVVHSGGVRSGSDWIIGAGGSVILLTTPWDWSLIRCDQEASSFSDVARIEIPTSVSEEEPLHGPAFTPDGKWLWLLAADGIHIWSTADLVERPVIPVHESWKQVWLSADEAWLWHRASDGLVLRSTATWDAVPLPTGVKSLSWLVPHGDVAIARADSGIIALRRAGAGWAFAGTLDGPAAKQLENYGPQPARPGDGAMIRWTIPSTVSSIYGAKLLDDGRTIRLDEPKLLADEHGADPLDLLRLMIPGQPVAVDRTAGLALAWHGAHAMAYDLAQPAVTPPTVRVATADAAASLPARAARLAMPNRESHTTIALPDGRTVTPVMSEAHQDAIWLLGAEHAVVAMPDGIAIYAYAGGPARVVPLPDHAKVTAGAMVTLSADGKTMAVQRQLEGDAALACMTWTYRIADGALIAGPVRSENSQVHPANDGRSVTWINGIAQSMADGTSRPYQAGDAVPIAVGATPARTLDPDLVATGSFQGHEAIYARDTTSGRLRVLRIGQTMHDSWARMAEFDGPEAIGPERSLGRTINFLPFNNSLPSADLSPDAQRVVVLHEADGVVALYAASTGDLLADYSINRLFGAHANIGAQAVAWVDDRTLRFTGTRYVPATKTQEPMVVVVELPRLTSAPDVLARQMEAFALRSLSRQGELVEPTDLPAGVRAWRD